MKKYNKIFYQMNQEKEKERTEKYRKLNPTKVKIIQKSWYDKHGAQYRALHTKELLRNHVKYAKKRRETDLEYKIVCKLRSRIITAIKRQYGKKAFRTHELIGCTIPEVRRYIELKFEPWMSWDNHGEWEIDHIIPLASFDLTDPKQQQKAFHYTNLQPLSWQENLKKFDKLLIG
ncbi:MAG: hypothetical protein RBG13Loki_0382 [Promethearchaeota archaeon CR_4]|nr:MAG: hypothetical protein RBG13Loki_0382 [Candidatus Lokiarchaeota archaeon CR_4]